MSLLGAAIGALAQREENEKNRQFQAKQASLDREENFYYGEQAANAADARTRKLYNDLQSPAAMLRQYKEAGLSPSLMFGGSGASGATPASGAQGTGAAGVQTNYGANYVSPMESAQLGLMSAETQKTMAEGLSILGLTIPSAADVLKVFQDTATSLAQQGLMESSTALNNAQTAIAKIEKNLKSETYFANVDEINSEAEKARAEVLKAQAEARSATAQAKVDEETIHANIDITKQTALELKQRILLEKSEIKLNKKQLQKLDTEISEINYSMALAHWRAQLDKNQQTIDAAFKTAQIKLGRWGRINEMNAQEIEKWKIRVSAYTNVLDAYIGAVGLQNLTTPKPSPIKGLGN